MIYIKQELEIDHHDIFKNDWLERKEIIENLSKLFMDTKNPFVLNINSQWGSGKTTFVKLWKAYLKKEMSIDSIYFSAWEDDFSKEPLISLLGELNTHLKNVDVDKNIQQKFKEIKIIASSIIKKSLPSLVKFSTAGILDIEKDFEKALSSLTEAGTLEMIENHEKTKDEIKNFKKLLSEVVKEISPDKPLIFFIDELDRCRPTYAIELLERIKHVFGIKQVIFIFSTDKEQLSFSIQSLYGTIDTENYLRRFFDMEFTLPQPLIEKYLVLLEANYAVSAKLEGKSVYLQQYDSSREKLIEYLFYKLGISLRQVEGIYRYLSLIYGTSFKTFLDSHLYILPILLSLKFYNSELYRKAVVEKDEQIKEEILKILIQKFDKYNKNIVLDYILESVIMSIFDNHTQYKRYLLKIQRDLEIITNKKEKEKFKFIINLHQENGTPLYEDINYAIKKIELLDGFTFSDDEFLKDN